MAVSVGYLARTLTFPTGQMDMHADRCIKYIVATADHGITFDGHAPHQLQAYSDSDWSVGHSTTGYVLTLAGGSCILLQQEAVVHLTLIH